MEPNRKNQFEPAIDWYEITPSDTVALDPIPSGIFVGTGGDLAVESADGNTVVFKNILDGTVLPIRPKYVDSTDTTATDLVALK